MDEAGISADALQTGLQNLGLTEDEIAGVAGKTETPPDEPGAAEAAEAEAAAAKAAEEEEAAKAAAAPAEPALTPELLEAREAAAYWRGMAEAAKTQAAPAADTRDEVTPEREAATLRHAKLALARKLDDNEITNAEFTQQSMTIDARLEEMRDERFQALMKQGQQETATQLTEAQALEQFQALEKQYPVTRMLTTAAMSEFADDAKQRLAAEGTVLTPDAQGQLPIAQRLALARVIAPMAQEKYAGLIAGGAAPEAAKPAAPAAAPAPEPTLKDALALMAEGKPVPETMRPLVAAALEGKAAGAPGKPAAPAKPAATLPPDIRRSGDSHLGVIEGGLNEKSVMDLVSAGRIDAIDDLVAKDPDAAERYALGIS